MAWIKRNLALFISGVIAVVLLGLGGWYWWDARAENARIDEELGNAKTELDRLTSADPFPSQSNIVLARQELERMTNFVAETKKLFPPAPRPEGPLNNERFKSLLQTTIAELHKQAEAGGIGVETNYYFSFEAQRLPITFSAESLVPLVERLHDVKTVSSVLFQAKVNRLEAARRATVPGETRTGNDHLQENPRPSPETGMQIWPYEFVFQCFTPELASVMENINRLPDMMIVRSVVAEPAERRDAPIPLPGGQTMRTNRPPTLETLLNEHVLRITMKVDVVRPEIIRPDGMRPPGGRPPRS